MSTELPELRPGEIIVDAPEPRDAALVFIGRIRTPFPDRAACPRQGSLSGPECRLELDEVWWPALKGLEAGMRVQVLYWLHFSRRDLVVQNPRGKLSGTFAIRSPQRPNPIASSVCMVERVEEGALVVRGLDCVDGTPLIDIKPEWCPHA